MVTVPLTKYSLRIVTAPASPHLNASFSVAFRQVWLYFQVPSSEPPQAPAYGQICVLGDHQQRRSG